MLDYGQFVGAGCRWAGRPGPASIIPRSISTTFTTIRPWASIGPTSLAEVDPELLRTYERLGIPLKEQGIPSGVRRQDDKSSLDGEDGVYSAGNVAVDAIFDLVSVVTTFKHELAKAGVIFCSISRHSSEHPDLVRKYLGSVVPQAIPTPPSIRRCSPTAPSSTCRRTPAARWSSRPFPHQ